MSARPVLIGYDGLDDAALAIRRAGELLAGRPAVVACVWESFAGLLLHADIASMSGTMRAAAEEFDADQRRRAQEIAAAGVRLAGEAGFEAEPADARGKPKAWPTLVHLADEHDAEAIVIGSEGLSGLRGLLYGSVEAGVLHHCHRPVLVVPRAAEHELDGPLLIAYDGSDHAREAITAAGGLLAGHEAIVQTVWRSYVEVAAVGRIGMPSAMAAAGAERIDAELAERARQTAEHGAELARTAGLDARAEAPCERGNVCRTLLDGVADHGAAALVVGSRGRSALGAALLGSVSAALVRHAKVPVLVVPPQERVSVGDDRDDG